jgi:hypothetical protein
MVKNRNVTIRSAHLPFLLVRALRTIDRGENGLVPLASIN